MLKFGYYQDTYTTSLRVKMHGKMEAFLH